MSSEARSDSPFWGGIGDEVADVLVACGVPVIPMSQHPVDRDGSSVVSSVRPDAPAAVGSVETISVLDTAAAHCAEEVVAGNAISVLAHPDTNVVRTMGDLKDEYYSGRLDEEWWRAVVVAGIKAMGAVFSNTVFRDMMNAPSFSMGLAKTSKKLLVENAVNHAKTYGGSSLVKAVIAVWFLPQYLAVQVVGKTTEEDIVASSRAEELRAHAGAALVLMMVVGLVALLAWMACKAIDWAGERCDRYWRVRNAEVIAPVIEQPEEAAQKAFSEGDFEVLASWTFCKSLKTGTEFKVRTDVLHSLFGRAPTLDSAQQESTQAGSEMTLASNMPRYMCFMRIERPADGASQPELVHAGVVFRFRKFLVTAAHVLQRIEPGMIIELWRPDGPSVRWIHQVSDGPVSPMAHHLFVMTPYPDAAVIVMSDAEFTKLGGGRGMMPSVRHRLGAGAVANVKMSVTVFGTIAGEPSHVYCSGGFLSPSGVPLIAHHTATTQRGFSGSPVIQGSVYVNNPIVVAIHTDGSGSTNKPNSATEFAFVAHYLVDLETGGYKRRLAADDPRRALLAMPEDSYDFFLKYVKENKKEIEYRMGRGEFYQDTHGGGFAMMIRGKPFYVSDDEFARIQNGTLEEEADFDREIARRVTEEVERSERAERAEMRIEDRLRENDAVLRTALEPVQGASWADMDDDDVIENDTPVDSDDEPLTFHNDTDVQAVGFSGSIDRDLGFAETTLPPLPDPTPLLEKAGAALARQAKAAKAHESEKQALVAKVQKLKDEAQARGQRIQAASQEIAALQKQLKKAGKKPDSKQQSQAEVKPSKQVTASKVEPAASAPKLIAKEVQPQGIKETTLQPTPLPPSLPEQPKAPVKPPMKHVSVEELTQELSTALTLFRAASQKTQGNKA